ncbi:MULTISPECIES: RNA polymerase sigma factor [Flavobacteriaceae]|uniref:RNA polymerase sigma factor, sigma-70 family n=1 Tax=Galbibacter orientalis DSM 19592 TaxID=926559 RepID=I3CAL3_9FLAO|nr:sigma-70 family RNA polymerase sigma factor [Galbibacter orientalis]EIJ40656.1 RNA polymerase sigma factor, sigma-70 family [Galbibacter orientalis DSM 19592]
MKIRYSKGVAIDNQTHDREHFCKISKGEYASLEVIFDKYYDDLCRFGLSYESNIAIVEEKISDVFILLWNKRKQLKKIEKPKSYIYVIAKHSLLKKTKISQLHYSLDGSYSQDVPFSPSIEDEMIDQEQEEINTQLIQSILGRIPQKSRRVFELSRIDGFKYKDISEILDLSPRTVENHIALAMKHIRLELEVLRKKNRK